MRLHRRSQRARHLTLTNAVALWFMKAQVARGRGVLGPRKPVCPVGDVPGFASTGPARDCESAAHSGDASKTHWIDLSATSPSDAETLQGEDASGGICRNRCPAPLGPLEVQGALNETDPVLVASRKRRSAGTGLRGDGPGGGLAPASSHLDGGSRSETSAARAVRDRSGARTPAVTASRTRSTVPARGQTSGSNLVVGSKLPNQ